MEKLLNELKSFCVMLPGAFLSIMIFYLYDKYERNNNRYCL